MNAPHPTRLMLWPVYGYSERGLRESVATFFTSSDATDFAMHPERNGFEPRNLYLAEPNYDRRASGYRPISKPSGYAEWLASLDGEQREAA